MKYHFGCGTDILPGYVNCDTQDFPGVDLVTDLSRPNLSDGVGEVFSNAFYEHLYLKDRVPHLRSVYKSLSDTGIINYMGMPFFPGIADAYLHGAPGTIRGQSFDLYHVYRYTHGAPEETGEYLPQLHKGLFDVPEIDRIFEEVGIDYAAVYKYCYPGESTNTKVTFGIYLGKGYFDQYRDAALGYLEQWDNIYINLSTIEFI